MAINPALATAAYKAASRIAEGAPPPAAGSANGTDFGSMLADAVKDAVATIGKGEAAAMEGATGKADIVQVVNAVTSAELTLETVVAIRDKVIAAYQDILRMPI